MLEEGLRSKYAAAVVMFLGNSLLHTECDLGVQGETFGELELKGGNVPYRHFTTMFVVGRDKMPA